MSNIQTFNELAAEYDHWFDEHSLIYESELQALRKHIPAKGKGIEIGVGSGRFAESLGITAGVEPADGMAELAKQRGIKVVKALAEDLPFGDEIYDFVLFVTTLCFVDNPWRAVREAHRILKPGGSIIIGTIDRDTALGQTYLSMKNENPFYRNAQFYSAREVLQLVIGLGFANIKICQTLFSSLDEITSPQPIIDGYGAGGFVVISGEKCSGSFFCDQYNFPD